MIREFTYKIWLLACLIIGCWLIFMQTPIKETLSCTQGQCTFMVYYIFKRPASSGLDMNTLANKKLTVHYQIQRRLMNYYEIAYPQDKYYYNIASTYFKLGDIQLAKKYYNLAISHNPQNQNYHFALANLYYSEKHYKRAMEELQGDFFEACLLKAIILYDTGYLAIAKKEFDGLVKNFPENEIVNDYKARIDGELGV